MWRIVDGYLQSLLTVEQMTEPYCMPRQGLPEVYWQNGYVDIVRPRVVLELGMMCGHKILPFNIREPVLEIDYGDDIARVEAALLRLQRGQLPRSEQGVKRYPA